MPRNVERLRANLAGYEDRYTLREAAVAPAPGACSFGVEDSGRYGGIGVETGRTIEVACVGHQRRARARCSTSVPAIDVLKIDTEGTELEILGRSGRTCSSRVRTVYLEVERAARGRPRRVRRRVPQRDLGAAQPAARRLELGS